MPIDTNTAPKTTSNGFAFDHEKQRTNKPKLNKLVILLIGVISVLSLVVFTQNVFLNEAYKQESASNMSLLENKNLPLAVSRNNIQAPSKPNIFPNTTLIMTTYQEPVPPSTRHEQAQDISQGYTQNTQAPSKSESGSVTQNTLALRTVYVPAGISIGINLESTLSSALSMVGDSVTASLDSPIVVASDVIASRGSKLTGSVITSIPARKFRAGDAGSLGIKFTEIRTPNGKYYPLSATYNIRGATGAERLAKGLGKTAIGAGTGAALGTAVGAIASGMPGRGAWSGAAIGGGLGIATALLSKGDEAVLSSGTKLTLVTEQSFSAVVNNQ